MQGQSQHHTVRDLAKVSNFTRRLIRMLRVFLMPFELDIIYAVCIFHLPHANLLHQAAIVMPSRRCCFRVKSWFQRFDEIILLRISCPQAFAGAICMPDGTLGINFGGGVAAGSKGNNQLIATAMSRSLLRRLRLIRAYAPVLFLNPSLVS